MCFHGCFHNLILVNTVVFHFIKGLVFLPANKALNFLRVAVRLGPFIKDVINRKGGGFSKS